MNNLIPLLLFSFASSFTPGPNNFMIMNAGLQFGIKKSMPHYWGICLGFPVMVLIIAIGLGAIFTQYSWLKQTLKIVGAVYMLYLAWQILRSNKKANTTHTLKPLNFLQALLFQWINPKAWLMGVGAISMFTLTNSYINNAILISIIYMLMCMLCVGAWLVFGAILQHVLQKDTHRAWFNLIMAVALVASIGMIFID